MAEDEVRQSFEAQAGYCESLGSPFTALLCRLIAKRLDTGSLVGKAVLGWQGRPDAKHDALALRLAGGLHRLVLDGHSPALAAVYPPNRTADHEAIWAALQTAFDGNGAALVAALQSAPQTNEVRRSALLMAGAAVIAAETGLPLELNELGASAGLNLIFDRYEHRLGGARFGTIGSKVCLTPEWNGSAPPAAHPEITAAFGVDLNPIHVEQPADRTRLLSYVWADQSERLARTEAAIDIAAADPPSVAAADAADWLEERLRSPHRDGVVRVVTHTIAVQYFPEAVQHRIARALEQAGGRAIRTRPVARLGFELPKHGAGAELSLTLWPNGASRRLAVADPRGGTITWG